MTGDIADICRRLKLCLPSRWFSDEAPVLHALFSGFATAWSTLYDLLQFTVRQSRLRTATGNFLDMAAQDLLSDPFLRRSNENDGEFRLRLLDAIQRTRGTRAALQAAASAAGYSVTIFEAAQPGDTGCYNVVSKLAWSKAGAWGSMQMPLESLAVARPGAAPFEGELWSNVSNVAPAGGVIWMTVKTSA